MNNYRRQQFIYIAVDILSSLTVWICFLLFRWMVYDGRIFSVNDVLIPAFNFYRPLILYPLFCTIVYYLSGYYIDPLNHKYGRELEVTLLSAMVISGCAFFTIIIDDVVVDYRHYITSLGVLFFLQFLLSYFPRLIVTHLTRKHVHRRVFTLHHAEDLASFEAAHRVQPFDAVWVALQDDNRRNDLYPIIRKLYPYHVEICVEPDLFDVLSGAAKIEELSDSAVIRITKLNMSNSELCIKRAFDVVTSSLTMLLLSPLYLAIAVAVKCSSPGPILYRQERIGFHGVSFHILKFRTMVANSEGATPKLTEDNDPRVTRVGHFLRKYRLDELPQMWNILMGEMSIVGPRPEREYFIRQIEEKAPYYCLLYKVRPGLTSWGPIRVGYTDTLEKMVQRLNYDLTYMENMSIRLDLKIMFYTIAVIVDGKGK